MATDLSNQTPPIVLLAERIEDDIRQKSLKPGDAYLGAAGAARMLRVSTGAANRAMQLLAQRNVLERRQRKGTFIAQTATERARIRRVHLLVRQDFLKTEGVLADGTLIGIQGTLPGAELQFNFMPADDEAAYVARLIAEATRSAEPEGFVLVRASLAAQRLVAASGLPAVVNGILFPSIAGLAWIDRDHYQVGQLLCRRLLEAGHRRIAVLMHDRVLPGHHQTLDAVRDTLSAAGLGAEALTQRWLPQDEQVVAHEVTTMLEASPRRLGIICRSKPLADAAARSAELCKLPARRRPTITVCDLYGGIAARSPYVYARQMLTPQQIGSRIGCLLDEQAAGKRAIPDHETIPVELIEPTA